MAKTKNIDNTSEVIVKEEKTEQESNLYFFYTQGCGWCKKVIPLVDALNEEGYNILKLDLADGENGKLQNEIKTEYKHQCGTPYFVDGETGNMICGFREKDVLKDWADGKEIKPPPRPKGPVPKLPLMGAPKKEITQWKKEYKKWSKENKHLPKVQTVDEILARPRPKTEPPKPPNPQGTDAELDTWGKEYDKWKNENDHLPNLQPVESILERFKQQRGAQNPQPPQSAVQPPVDNTKINSLEAKVTALEVKLDKIMSHFGVK